METRYIIIRFAIGRSGFDSLVVSDQNTLKISIHIFLVWHSALHGLCGSSWKLRLLCPGQGN